MRFMKVLAVLWLPLICLSFSSAASEGESESFKDYRYKGSWNLVDRTEWDWTIRIHGDGDYFLYTGDPKDAGIAAVGTVSGVGGSGSFVGSGGTWQQDPTYAGGEVPGQWTKDEGVIEWASDDGTHSTAMLCELGDT